MAITKERMFSLINAAVEYRALATTMSRRLNATITQSKTMTSDQFMLAIIDIANSMEYAIAEHIGRHDTAISREFDKFYRNQTRNEHAKIKMQIKRRAAGTPARSTIRNLNEAKSLELKEEIATPPPPHQRIRQSPDMTEDELDEYNRLEEDNRRKQEEAENRPFHQDGQPSPLTFPNTDESEDEGKENQQ